MYNISVISSLPSLGNSSQHNHLNVRGKLLLKKLTISCNANELVEVTNGGRDLITWKEVLKKSHNTHMPYLQNYRQHYLLPTSISGNSEKRRNSEITEVFESRHETVGNGWEWKLYYWISSLSEGALMQWSVTLFTWKTNKQTNNYSLKICPYEVRVLAPLLNCLWDSEQVS